MSVNLIYPSISISIKTFSFTLVINNQYNENLEEEEEEEGGGENQRRDADDPRRSKHDLAFVFVLSYVQLVSDIRYS